MLIEKLKQKRLQLGYTQAEIAEFLNLSQNAISNYENGHRGMSLEDFEKYAYFLGCEVSITDRNENKLLKELDFNKQIDWKQYGKDFFNQIWIEERKFIFPKPLHPNPNDNKEVLINKKLFYSSFLSAASDQIDSYNQHDLCDTMIYVDYSDGTVLEYGPTVVEIDCTQFQARLEYLYHHHPIVREMFDTSELRVSVKAFDMCRGDILFPIFPLLKDTPATKKYVSLGFDLFSFRKNLKES